MIEKLRVGIISSVHGIKGETKVYPTSDEKDRFLKLKRVYYKAGESEKVLELERARYSKNMVICKFKGIDTPEEALKYKNTELYMDRKDVKPLKSNENYIVDLIDLEVYTDDDALLGRVSDVFETGANHVMEVEKEDGRKILIPYIKQCILKVDLEEGRIYVHLLDGLLDIYN